jgi:hypothetical protein
MATDVKEGQVKSDLDQITFPKISSCIGLVALKCDSGHNGSRALIGAHFYGPTQQDGAQYKPEAMWRKINTENRLNRFGHVTTVYCIGSLYTWSESDAVTYSWPTDFIKSIIHEFGQVNFMTWDSGSVGNGSFDIRLSIGMNNAASLSYRPSDRAGDWTSVPAASLTNMSATLQGWLAYV